MATSSAADFLKKRLNVENEIVTFRLLSRELSIHVNEAKNELASFYETSVKSSHPVYATYLLSGDIVQQTTEEDSKQATPSGEPPRALITRRKIILATQDELEVVRKQFLSIVSSHIYSLSVSAIKDSAILTTSTQTVRQQDGANGLEAARKLGMSVAPDVKWSAAVTKGKGKANAPKPTTKAEASTSKGLTKVSTVLDVGEKKPSGVKKEPTPVPPTKPAPSTSKATLSEKEPTPKPEEPKKKAGTLDWSKAKTRPSAPTPDPKPIKSEGHLKVKPEKPTSKAGQKRATPASDGDDDAPQRNVKVKLETTKTEPMPKRRPYGPASKTGQAQVRKGRVMSDDEEEEEEEDHVVMKKQMKNKRKSAAANPKDTDDEEEESPPPKRMRKSVSKKQEASLRAMMDVEDKDETEETTTPSFSPDEEEEDSAPEHVPLKSKVAPVKEKKVGIDVSTKPKKRKSVARMGENGKRMRRVTKSRTTTNAKGYMVTEDYSSYEEDNGSADGSADEKPKPKNKAKRKAKSSSSDEEVMKPSKKAGSSAADNQKEESSKNKKSAPPPKKKASIGSKPAPPKSLMSYFGKS